jgi:hypothetical protein
LSKVEPYVKIYPRTDIADLPARERKQVDTLLGPEAAARWAETGEVKIIEATNCVEHFGKKYNQPYYRVVPIEGCRLPTVLAGSLLRRYPLLLSSLPADGKKESKKK